MNKGIPRIAEATIALFGLLISSPLILIGMFGVAVSSPGPLFFRQERLGRKGRAFFLIKLRSMKIDKQGFQITARGDHRITGFGKILRKTKIDELPELWNVVRGDLGLVGPRPEVPQYVDLKNPLWKTVLEARPGITDPVTLRLRNEEELLAQVEGNREQFYLNVLQPVKLRGYLEYLENRNCWADIKILWKSLTVIIFPSKTSLPTLSELQVPDFKL